MRRDCARALLLFVALCGASAEVCAQPRARAGEAVISGRITIEGEPAPGIRVAAIAGDYFWNPSTALALVITDGEGRYRLAGLPVGRVTISPVTASFIAPIDRRLGFPGQTLLLGEGETIENIDFALTRGGVITGRVTDAAGRPVIGEPINLHPLDQSPGARSWMSALGPYMQLTDDRGVYRLFGVVAGRYRVSVGQTADDVTRGFGGPRRSFQRTFHPDVPDEERARIVEITAGSETTGVDITVGRQFETFSVSGRVVEEESERPMPQLLLGYGALMNNDRIVTRSFSGRTDARGYFRLDNLTPGRYALLVTAMGQNREYYAADTPFEIKDGDVAGLVVRVRRGATASGSVIVEGISDRSLSARLSYLPLAHTTDPPGNQEYFTANITPDGSFQLTGLRPGRLRFNLFNMDRRGRGFYLARVEHNGVEQREGIEIEAGGNITGVRVVLRQGASVVSGQVIIVGGTLPPDAYLFVLLFPPGETAPDRPVAESQVDARGRFRLEAIPGGTYELRLHGYGGPARLRPTMQTIHVADGGETAVTLTLDLSAQEGRQP